MGGWGTQYQASSINRATKPASKRRPEYPVTPIRPAPWRRFLSRTAIDAACAAPAPPQARSGTQKQNCGPNCNFFAIRDCCVAPGRGSKHKSAGNQPQNGPFSLFGDRKESLIVKKLQRSRGFCFHARRIAATGRNAGWHAERTQRPTLCAAYRTGMRWRNFTIMYARADKTRLSGEIALKRSLEQGFQLVFSTFETNLAKISVPTVHFSAISPESPTFRTQEYKIARF